MKINPMVHNRSRIGVAQAAQNELQTLWRSLWRQHVEWGHMAAEAMAAGQTDMMVAGDGLLRNAQDMATALERQYGRGLVAGFECLMRGHVWIALSTMKAMQAGDAAAKAGLEQERYANSGDLAAYLAAINPFLSQVAMADLLRQHQQITGAETAAIFAGDAAAAKQAYEMNLAQSALIADTMAAAISRQFYH